MKYVGLLGLVLLAPAWADAPVALCHGYGCLTQVSIIYKERQLADIAHRLRQAGDAADERQLLAQVVGEMYGTAGEQSVIRNDRGGNFADAGVEGAMDCIDHSTSTTRLLRLLEARRYLRWHRVVEPVVRRRFTILGVHYSAAIEELQSDDVYVVDSWFVDNGKPAVILPLEDWMKGAGPDV